MEMNPYCRVSVASEEGRGCQVVDQWCLDTRGACNISAQCVVSDAWSRPVSALGPRRAPKSRYRKLPLRCMHFA